MKTKPTWTRFGRGVILMGSYPVSEKTPGERESQTVSKPKPQTTKHPKPER